METWSERHLNKGIRQGRLEGRLEGLEEGRKESALHMLTRLLSKRFGPLDEAVQARLQAASLAELEAWADRLLEADTLAEVFQMQ